jgi:hypothetical protein
MNLDLIKEETEETKDKLIQDSETVEEPKEEQLPSEPEENEDDSINYDETSDDDLVDLMNQALAGNLSKDFSDYYKEFMTRNVQDAKETIKAHLRTDMFKSDGVNNQDLEDIIDKYLTPKDEDGNEVENTSVKDTTNDEEDMKKVMDGDKVDWSKKYFEYLSKPKTEPHVSKRSMDIEK